MDQQQIISQTVSFIKQKLSGEGTGHDWWHIHRVHNNAKHILESEQSANTFVVEMSALLHDIVDPKVEDALSLDQLSAHLFTLEIPPAEIDQILHIIDNMSFSKNISDKKPLSLEGQIVQDADRLDAIGAIGIARCFTYGGTKKREIYNPEIPFIQPKNTAEYRSLINGPSINHFYEKLLLLKDLMNTNSAKRIAQQRHEFMAQYLEQFYAEWSGER